MIKLEKEDIEELRKELKDKGTDFMIASDNDVIIARNLIIKQIGYNNDILKIRTHDKDLEIEVLRSRSNKITRLINLYNETHLIKRVYFGKIYLYIEFDENLVYALRNQIFMID